MSCPSHDAVVIGAGHNGLVAANLLADRGWDVVVLESQPTAGGAVQSDLKDGFVHDVFSAFYPLAASSPVLRGLGLEAYGLTWTRAPVVLAHVLTDGRCAALSTDPAETASSLEQFAPGDGDRWLAFFEDWQRIGQDVLAALFTPFPPVRAGSRLVARLGMEDTLRFARRCLLPVRRLGEEDFAGEGARLLLAGNALHADLAPEDVLSGFFGWLLTCLGQDVGFPVPVGGAYRLIDALVARLEDRGGRVELGAEVTKVTLEGDTASGAETVDGRYFGARRAVLADVGAPQLFSRLVGEDALPADFLEDLSRFQYDNATVKVDWALDAPVPWKAAAARRAGTVHLADSVDSLTRYTTDMVTGRLPSDPFLVVGQMTTADPSRSPEGTESLWAYTHVPQSVDHGGRFEGEWDKETLSVVVNRMEDKIEACAPGFKELVDRRSVLGPVEMQAINPNLVGGAINGGTAALYQQLVFRPVPSLGRPQTPIKRLFLASASAHPGGGVHGIPGSNAARAALLQGRVRTAAATLAGVALGAGIVRRGRD